VALACAIFPLIWVGGLVTTTQAGMAVPDWPTTYGYNLFLYPWKTWVFGPWDLFIEHGHRLLGAFVGLLGIAFCLAVWLGDARKSMRIAAVALVALIVFQGVLGGMRVRLAERQLAMVHGIVGPMCFAFTVILADLTSRRARQRKARENSDVAKYIGLTSLTALFAWAQLVVGAQVRHVAVDADPNVFAGFVYFHLLLAAVLTLHVLAVAFRFFRGRIRSFAWPSRLLMLFILVQLALGTGTWAVKYGWPQWLPGYWSVAPHVVTAQGFLQSATVTGHVAVGSLILAFAALLAARNWQLSRCGAHQETQPLMRAAA